MSDILDLVRRVEWVVHQRESEIARNGPALWARLQGDDTVTTDDTLVGVLRAARELDELGGVLAQWAIDRAGDRPNALVDETVGRVRAQLDALGVPEQTLAPEDRAAMRRRG